MHSSNHFTRVGVIMAGGSGERFWPVSRQNHPKQLLRLASPTETMLGQAVTRLAQLIPREHIFVATGENLVEAIREAGVGVPPDNVIAEPCRRNTAGCLCYAAAEIMAKYDSDGSDISVAVVTADHLIGDEDRFRQTVEVTMKAAETMEVLATHGIVPTRPETGYGYIQARDAQGPIEIRDDIAIFPVAAFHEKPSVQKAEDFIADGHYYWNSGMFFWRLDVFLRELDAARPEMAKATREIVDAIRANDKASVRTIFEGLENISIDYALMEHAKNVVVARCDYEWDDVGAWTSLDRTREKDEAGNVAHGDPVLIDTRDSIVFNEAGADRIAVSVIGMHDVIVVVSKDGVVVMPKDRAQDVRKAVKELRARGSKHV